VSAEPNPRRAMARAVLLLWLGRALAGLLVGYPVARTVGAFMPPGAAYGDAVLFAPGGVVLLEVLRVGGRVLGASLESALLAFVAVSVATLFPLGLALAGLVCPGESGASLARRAARALPPLFALSGAAAVVQAVALTAVGIGLTSLAPAFAQMNERTGDLLVVTTAVVAGAPVLGLGILHDVARAAVIRTEARARTAVAIAWDALRRGPRRAVLAWAAPTGVGAIVVAAAAWATGALDVSRPGASRVVAVALLHQLAVATLVTSRLVWFARALALVPAAPAPAEPFTSEADPL
jgi:hypothetical protein